MTREGSHRTVWSGESVLVMLPPTDWIVYGIQYYSSQAQSATFVGAYISRYHIYY